MYFDPGDELGFGDIFEADWLFDIYVRADSVAMYRRDIANVAGPVWVVRGQATGRDEVESIKVAATMDPGDVVLTAGTRRMGIVLTDDCEITTLAGARDAGREPRGRILMAAIRKDDGKPRDELELGIHRLPPDDEHGFPGGLVDFNRLYEVQTKTLLEATTAKRLSLGADAKVELGERLAGHVLRQGPLAAESGARKLSRLLTARDNVERLGTLVTGPAGDWGDETTADRMLTLVRVLDEAWFLGRLLDQVDQLAEDTHAGRLADGPTRREELCRRYARTLAELAEAASVGARAFGDAARDAATPIS